MPAEQVVPGDVIELAEGDIVPADAEVIEAAALTVDESALTGESVPAAKSTAGEATDRLVSAGTVVVRGRGVGVVTATGTASAMGRIAGLLAPAPALTPLQRRLVGLGWMLAAVAVALCLPPLQELLGTTGLALPELGAVCALSVLGYLAARGGHRRPPPGT